MSCPVPEEDPPRGHGMQAYLSKKPTGLPVNEEEHEQAHSAAQPQQQPHHGRGSSKGPGLKQGLRAKTERAHMNLPGKMFMRKGQLTLALYYEGSIYFNP